MTLEEKIAQLELRITQLEKSLASLNSSGIASPGIPFPYPYDPYKVICETNC